MLLASSRSKFSVNMSVCWSFTPSATFSVHELSIVRLSSLIGVRPATCRAAARVSSVSIAPSPLVSTSLQGPTSNIWKLRVNGGTSGPNRLRYSMLSGV